MMKTKIEAVRLDDGETGYVRWKTARRDHRKKVMMEGEHIKIRL